MYSGGYRSRGGHRSPILRYIYIYIYVCVFICGWGYRWCDPEHGRIDPASLYLSIYIYIHFYIHLLHFFPSHAAHDSIRALTYVHFLRVVRLISIDIYIHIYIYINDIYNHTLDTMHKKTPHEIKRRYRRLVECTISSFARVFDNVDKSSVTSSTVNSWSGFFKIALILWSMEDEPPTAAAATAVSCFKSISLLDMAPLGYEKRSWLRWRNISRYIGRCCSAHCS